MYSSQATVVQVDEMPFEDVLMDLAGVSELPVVIPDWVLAATPMWELLDRAPACSCDCGADGCAGDRAPGSAFAGSELDGSAPCEFLRPGLDRPATLADLDPDAFAMPVPDATPVLECVAALQTAVAAVVEQLPSARDGRGALADVEAVLDCERRLRVCGLDRIADVLDRGLHELAGHASTRGWLLEVQPDADPTDVRFADQSRHFTFLRGAVADGLVPIAAGKKVTMALRRAGRWVDQRNNQIAGLPAADVIAGVIRNVPVLISEAVMGFAPGDHRYQGLVAICEGILTDDSSELTQLERGFTLLAECVPLDRLSGMLDRLFFALVPAELEKLAAEAEAKRRFDVKRRPDGMWKPSGLLTPECGEYLWTALNATMRRDPNNPIDTATAAALRLQGLDPYQPDTWPADVRERLLPAWDPTNPHPAADQEADRAGDPPAEDELLPRTRGERMHDAFENLCRTFLEKGLGGVHHKVPVGVNVTITDQGLTGQPGSMPAMGDSGQPIPRTVLRRWWCDSSVTAYVQAIGGKALRAIHTGRTLTGHERRALLIEQAGTCAIKGCRNTTRGQPCTLRPHHVRRYADDGITTLDQTVMICDTCHRDLHEGGKTLRLRDNRLINEQGWTETAPGRPPPPF